MNSSLFIAKAFIRHRRRGISRPVIRIAMIAIAVSVAVIIIAFSVVRGFQSEIRNKLIGFGSHITITSYDTNENDEHLPVKYPREDVEAIRSLDNIKAVYPTAVKPGLFKTADQIHGIIMKGVNKDFDWDFFRAHLVEGRIPATDSSGQNEILISARMSKLLNLKKDSTVRAYFMIPGEIQPRGRKFSISGIYSTGLSEMDDVMIIGSMAQIQKLNRWGDTLVGEYEILVNDFGKLDRTLSDVNNTIYYDLASEDIRVSRQRFFDWLGMLDSNVMIIMTLMIIVAFINILGILLIMILEKIRIIGILKAIGTGNGQLRKIFVFQSAYFVLKGALWGNIVSLAIIFLQSYFHLLPLSEDMYYMNHVPMLFQADYFLMVNAGILATTVLGLIIPSFIIRRIAPAKALRIE